MASTRTRKRKQQRQAAVARRADNRRWDALTRGQKSIEDPDRLCMEDMSETLRRAYEPYLRGMFAHNEVLMQQLFAREQVWVSGTHYAYPIRTNKKAAPKDG
jgi:transposase InsO family protein